MWIYLTTWVTPTSLFILINAVIATIAISSHFTADKSHHHQHGGPALLRPPSFLDRVKSFNFSPHHNSDADPGSDPDPDATRPTRSPSLLERLKSISLNRSDSIREPETTQHEHSVSQSNSDAATLTPATSLRRRLQKSLSEKLSWAETEELVSEIERRRPATARPDIGEPETAVGGGGGGDDEGGVDVRADDFINKFKQQLKLQRLESLLRYRDVIKAK